MEAAQAQADTSMARSSKGNTAIPTGLALVAAEANQLAEEYLTSLLTAIATINSQSILVATSPRSQTNPTATKTMEATLLQTEFQAKIKVNHKGREMAAQQTQEELFPWGLPTRSIS